MSTRRASIDDTAQSNLDFIFGLGVFLVTFMYAVSFVPGLFAPVQPDAIDLTSVTYRTSSILAEDPGWRIYAGPNGEPAGSADWESNDVDELARVGLAADKTLPNVISMDKVKALNTVVDYGTARDKMGLSGSVTYDMNLFLTMNHTVMGADVGLLSLKSPNYTNFNVEAVERRVMVDTGKQLMLDCEDAIAPSSYLTVDIVDIKPDDTHNITLRIFNASGNIEYVAWSTDISGMVMPTWTNGNDFLVLVNGVPMTLPAAFDDDDVVEVVVFNKALLRDAGGSLLTRIIWVHEGSHLNVLPGHVINYFNDEDYKLRSVCYPGTLRLEVWSNDVYRE